jgi:hypothetical protein
MKNKIGRVFNRGSCRGKIKIKIKKGAAADCGIYYAITV